MNISSRLEGLEPSTFGFGDQRSTNWTKDALNKNNYKLYAY